MSAATTARATFGTAHPPTHIAAWMTVAEARATLAAAGQPALPVAGHRGLIGLITVEALSGAGRRDGAVPDPDAPVASVMDWHLVQVPPDADELQVVRRYRAAGWRWLDDRALESTAPRGSTS
jgi:CBS domain-containing protein